MSVIRASVKDQVLKITEAPVVASGGQNEVKILFTFCDKWDGFVKTATFYRDEENVYSAALDDNNVCIVPGDVYCESGTFYIGVYGWKDAVIRTSTTVRYKVKKGSVSDGFAPTSPTYNELLEAVNDVRENSVRTTEQVLPEAQKTQARMNIGAEDYYHTEREEVEKDHKSIDPQYIYDLYDALDPNMVTWEKLGEVTYTKDGEIKTADIREYVISTGVYRDDGQLANRYEANPDITKPVYLIMSGIHGHERKGVFSTYRFIRDLVNGHNIPNALREGAIIRVIPVANPSGFDLYTNNNANGVNINRNFDNNWKKSTSSKYNYGDEAASEVETQIISDWLSRMSYEAKLFIDVHNSGSLNEVSAIIGDSDHDASHKAKEIALRGIDRVIPFWRDVIGYPETRNIEYLDDTGEFQTGDMPVIFSYPVDANEELDPTAFCYASSVLGIPSMAVELSAYDGDNDDWQNAENGVDGYPMYPKETIAAGAEVIGNILAEFYEQAFYGEVSEDMKQINSKLDDILQVASFCVKRGTFVLTEASTGTYTLNIPANAQTVEIRKVGEPTNVTKFPAFAHYVAYTASPGKGNRADACKNGYAEYMTSGKHSAASLHFDIVDGGIYIDLANDGYIHFESGVVYEWTAYYWND